VREQSIGIQRVGPFVHGLTSSHGRPECDTDSRSSDRRLSDPKSVSAARNARILPRMAFSRGTGAPWSLRVPQRSSARGSSSLAPVVPSLQYGSRAGMIAADTSPCVPISPQVQGSSSRA
jgi:hypothetical protein